MSRPSNSIRPLRIAGAGARPPATRSTVGTKLAATDSPRPRSRRAGRQRLMPFTCTRTRRSWSSPDAGRRMDSFRNIRRVSARIKKVAQPVAPG